MPILALHGAYSASDEIRNVFEPILAPLDAQRRIYPDLLGMGDSPPHDAIQTTRDIIDLLDEFIQTEIGDAPFLLAGHSYGGHLARGLAARRSGQIVGLELICPSVPATMNAEPRVVVSEGCALRRKGTPPEYLGCRSST